MDIGNRIKQRRIDLDISAEELADMIGKSRATIYRYENGDIENLPTTILEPLAEALNTTPAYLMGWEDEPIDYDNYDLPIPNAFNGDVKKYFDYEEAVRQDVLREQEDFDKFLQTISYLEKQNIEKYRELDTHGKEMVDFTLEKEWERSKALAEQKGAPIPMPTKEDTPDHLTPRAAHNDYETESGELERMKADLSILKKPN